MLIRNVHETYDRYTMLIMQMVLRDGLNCVDVGAHVGEILREMVRLSPSGNRYAFEPIPNLYQQISGCEGFRNVKIMDVALSDTSGEATFYWVVNDPAYSGLKQRRYDRPDPELSEIAVRKQRLDDIVPPDMAIDFIKIDVEGGELPVMRGAKRILTQCRPYIVFESGKGASDRYGTDGGTLYSFLSEDCGLEVNTLDGFLTACPALTRSELSRIFDTTERYYFIAHKPLGDNERMQHLRWFAIALDAELHNFMTIRDHIDRLEQGIIQLRSLLPKVEILDWGAKGTFAGVPVNEQPDGSSAIWIRARNISGIGNVYLTFGEHQARNNATVNGELVTSDIPPQVLQSPGIYRITLHEPNAPSTIIGDFVVMR